MDIKDIESQKKVFINYTDNFINENKVFTHTAS